MYTGDYIQPKKNNSEIIKHILNTLINTIMRKKGEKCAVSMVSSLIKELQSEYNFLQYVKIQDIRLLEDEERVIVTKSLDDILPTQIGKVIHVIILNISRSLGDKDGYFLIREFQQRVGSEYFSAVKTIGVDSEEILLEHILASNRFQF